MRVVRMLLLLQIKVVVTTRIKEVPLTLLMPMVVVIRNCNWSTCSEFLTLMLLRCPSASDNTSTKSTQLPLMRVMQLTLTVMMLPVLRMILMLGSAVCVAGAANGAES